MANIRLALIGCSILSAGLEIAAPAHAQLSTGSAPATATGSQAPNASAPLATPPGVETVGTIIVTAQRRSTTLQKTPVSVTAFSGKDLEQNGTQTIRDLLLATPNLQETRPITGDATSAVFFLRGLGIPRGALGIQPAVGIYIDDFYYPSVSGGVLRLLDLTSVEVLRGPQGTLFGRNTLGGAILYNTEPPSVSQGFGGHMEITGGSFDRIDGSGAVNIPLTSDLAIRLSGASFNTDGYIKDVDTGKTVGNTTDGILRGQIRWKPTSKITDDLELEGSREDIDGTPDIVDGITSSGPNVSTIVNLYDNGVIPGIGAVLPPAPAAAQYDSRYVYNCKYCQPGTNLPDFSRDTVGSVKNTLTWKLSDNLTLKSLTGYFHIYNTNRVDLDRTPVFLVENQLTTTTENQFSQELQLVGQNFGGKFDWIAGFYYYHYTLDQYRDSGGYAPGATPTVGPVTNPAPGMINVSTDDNNSYALYAQGTYALTSKLSFTAGGRFSRDDVSVTSQAEPSPVSTPPGASFNDFSPTVKLAYQWTPTIMTYGSVSKGYRGGAINTETQLQPSLGFSVVKPDTQWTYELGVRTEFFQRHLRLNVTAFDSDYSNVQLIYTYPLHIGGVVPPTIYFNGGHATVKGMELESEGALGNFRLRVSGALLDAHYDSLTNPPDDTTQPFGPVPVNSPVTLDSHFQHAPAFTYSIGGSYYQALPVGDIRYALDWDWQGEQFSTDQVADTQRLPSYGLLNAHLNYDVNDHLTFSLNLTNLLNKYYYVGGANTESVLGPSYLEPGTPRAWAITAKYRF